ncbi:MAG: TolC family protein [Chthoniobacteraceae bacterium]
MLHHRRRALPLLLLLATSGLRAEDAASPPVKSPTIPRLRVSAPLLRVPMGTATKTISTEGNLESISLQDALGRAFAHNLDAKFDKVDIKIDQARKRFAEGVFDPVLTVSASRESIQRPDNTANITSADSLIQIAQLNAIQANTRAIQIATGQPVTPFQTPGRGRVVVFDQDTDRIESGVQFRTPLGTRMQISARQSKIRSTFDGDTRSAIPFFTAFGGLEVRQPLLKDFGPNANLADLRVARINLKISELSWEKRLSDTAQQVMATYFDMLFALADLAVKQDAIDADEKLVAQNQRRLDVGFKIPYDVQQARAAVSQDQEQLLGSKNLFMERQFLLKRLILDDYKLGSSRVFVPQAIPDIPIPKINRAALLTTAFAKRLDYRAAITEAGIQDIRLKFAKNQLWPQLDLVGSYGYNGLAFDYATARQKAYHSQAPEWSFGIQLSIPLGGIQSRAQLGVINGFKEQALIKIKQIEQTVSIDVDTVISRIETLKQRFETARNTTKLGEEAVRIASGRMDIGLDDGGIGTFQLIETQRRLYEARSRELAARTELNKAISQLWLATGTILEETGITVKRN